MNSQEHKQSVLSSDIPSSEICPPLMSISMAYYFLGSQYYVCTYIYYIYLYNFWGYPYNGVRAYTASANIYYYWPNLYALSILVAKLESELKKKCAQYCANRLIYKITRSFLVRGKVLFRQAYLRLD